MYTTCIKNIMAAIKWSIPCDHRFPSFIPFIRRFFPGVVCGVGGGLQKKNNQNGMRMVDALCVFVCVCVDDWERNSLKSKPLCACPKMKEEKCLTIWGCTLSFLLLLFHFVPLFFNVLLNFSICCFFLNFSWACF